MFGYYEISSDDLISIAYMNVSVLVSKYLDVSYYDNIKAFLFERKILRDDQLGVLYETIKGQHDFEVANNKEYLVKDQVEGILKRLLEAKGSKQHDERRTVEDMERSLNDLSRWHKNAGLDESACSDIKKSIVKIRSHVAAQLKINEAGENK